MTKQIVNLDSFDYTVQANAVLQRVVGVRTGKTTAAILRAIADAHDRPGEAVAIDEDGIFDNSTLRADPVKAEGLSAAARSIVSKLGLTRVEVSTSPYTGMPAIISNFAVVI